jgi:hypothetical protein
MTPSRCASSFHGSGIAAIATDPSASGGTLINEPLLAQLGTQDRSKPPARRQTVPMSNVTSQSKCTLAHRVYCTEGLHAQAPLACSVFLLQTLRCRIAVRAHTPNPCGRMENGHQTLSGRSSRRRLLDHLLAASTGACGSDIEQVHGPAIYLQLTRMMAWLRAAVVAVDAGWPMGGPAPPHRGGTGAGAAAATAASGRAASHGSDVARLLRCITALVTRPTGTGFLERVGDAGGIAAVTRLVARGFEFGPSISHLSVQLVRAIARGGRLHKERLCRGGILTALTEAVTHAKTGESWDDYRGVLCDLAMGNTTCEHDVIDTICDIMERCGPLSHPCM